MYVVVTAGGSSKNLFVGDVLYNTGPSEEDVKLYECRDLTNNLSYQLSENQIQPATNEDVFGAFLSKSGSWVFHQSKSKKGDYLDYLAKVVKIDVPYLYHESGNDFIRNFIPASDDMIAGYREGVAESKGFIKGAKIKDTDKVTGTIYGFELDSKTKDLLVLYKDADEKYYKNPLQQLKIVKKQAKKKVIEDYPLNT